MANIIGFSWLMPMAHLAKARNAIGGSRIGGSGENVTEAA